MATIAAGSSSTIYVPIAQSLTLTPGTGGKMSLNGRNQDGSAVTPQEIYTETTVALRAGATITVEAINVDATCTGVADSLSSVSGGGLPVLTAYATTIPLDSDKYMPQTQVSGAVVFTAGATLAPGAQCTLTLLSNGVNTPTFSGFRKWGGSSAWDNTNGAVNELTFFMLGTRAYYSIGQSNPLETAFSTQFVRFSSLTSMTESGDATAGYSYTTTTTSNQVAKTASLAMAADGYVEATVQTIGVNSAWLLVSRYSPGSTTPYIRVTPAFIKRW
jgi:hypothetical protein